MAKMKLGSLFDGSGGFPLAGAIHGITPVWASEIEPYPIRVTKARFPQMKHLGSVLDVNGAEVEPVGIITFGSPCQDLSVAGKQAGLHKGERSNLFFEAIRIIKEMRRSTDGMYPRIAVWENVPGAYSSNKGEDFRAVLQAFCSVKDETADVPRPAAGKWNPAGAIVGNGWSVAWRTFDAQYWGVPQRRKRIYLIADFGSERAGEVLLVEKSVHGDSAESGTAGQSAAGDAAGSVGRGVQCLNPSMPQSSRIYSADGVYPCLSSNASGGLNRQAVCYVAAFMGGQGAKARTIAYSEEVSPSIKSVPSGSNTVPDVCYAVRTRNTMANGWGVAENANTLDTSEGQAVAYSVDCRNMNLTKEHGTLQAKENGGQSLNYMGAVCYPIDSHQQDSRFKVCADGISPTLPGQMGTGGNNGPMVLEAHSAGNGQLHQALEYEKARPLDCMHDQQIVLYPSKLPRKYIIRRLTPLECCRLQGFPDWWEDGVQGSDSARYKMWGNGIALPNATYVIGCAKKLIGDAQ